jgi:RNA polymerase sigma factor (TIGR02999 family)
MAEHAERAPGSSRVQEVFEELRASGKSTEEIFVAVFQDLKALARKMLSRQPAGDSMCASRLLSDLWIRLFGKSTAEFDWQSGSHFFNGMAHVMRHMLIDHARYRRAQIRNKDEVESLDGLLAVGVEAAQDPASAKNKNWFQEKADQTLALEESFKILEMENPRQAAIIELRVYGGLSEAETAEVLKVSSETVTKEFAKAKRRLAYHLKISRQA